MPRISGTLAPAEGPVPEGSADDLQVRGGRGKGLTAAAVLVAAALLVPTVTGRPPTLTLSFPLEAVLAAVVLVALPVRARLGVGTTLGVLLGLLTVLRLVDLGFFAALAKPFDPLFDWSLFGSGYAFLRGSFGGPGALLAAVATIAVAAGVIAGLTRAVRRLVRELDERPDQPVVLVAVLLAALALPALAAPVLVGRAPGTGVSMVADRIVGVREGLADEQRFAEELSRDAYAQTPGSDLLTGLREKDVVLVFVESYGRDAVEDPALDGPIGAVLDTGTRRLAAVGLGARSGFLTSPTFGGSSWLAHGTLLAGTWVDSQHRYRQLVGSDRLTLNRAFHRAGWRTVGVAPGTTGDWPEGAFFGFDAFHDSRTLGYRGPNFSWATMPDQYTLSAFRRLELDRPDRARPPGRRVMAEIQLVSSHAPWTPVPARIDWNRVGDGSVFAPMAVVDEPAAAILTRDPARVRADYVRSIGYSLDCLVSYLETYRDRDLVLILLGDHQPNPIVTGDSASHDVPISIVAEPAVLHRIADWGWSPGLRPRPGAPVWRMDAFRDRFLAAYGSTPGRR